MINPTPNTLLHQLFKGFMDNVSVNISKGHETPGLEDEDFVFLQPFDRLLQLFPEELFAEAYFPEYQFRVFKHGRTFFDYINVNGNNCFFSVLKDWKLFTKNVKK